MGDHHPAIPHRKRPARSSMADALGTILIDRW
jgi:hypothetical protein